MNDQLVPLLEKLADNLGTTSEYLFGVLVTQAPISAAGDLFAIVVILALSAITFSICLRKAKEYPNAERYAILAIFSAISFVIFTIIGAASISTMLAGFFNPEYWALKEILSAIK